jgi:hypothetical protein
MDLLNQRIREYKLADNNILEISSIIKLFMLSVNNQTIVKTARVITMYGNISLISSDIRIPIILFT